MSPDSLPLSQEVQAKVNEWRDAGIIIPQLPYMESAISLLTVCSVMSSFRRCGVDFTVAVRKPIFIISNQLGIKNVVSRKSMRQSGMYVEPLESGNG